MSLSYSTDISVFLFEGWQVKGATGFIGALISVVILVLVTEALSFFIQYKLVNQDKTRSPYYSLAYFLLRFLNYTEMLVAMSFNIWLILALAVTSALSMSAFGKFEDNLFIAGLEQKKAICETKCTKGQKDSTPLI